MSSGDANNILCLVTVSLIFALLILHLVRYYKKPKWLRMFYIWLGALAILGGTWAFFLPIAINSGFNKSDDGPVLRQLLIYTTGGLLGAITLGETRRKNDQEHMRQVHAERRSRYAKAIEQLADEKAPIRLGGVYTLAKLVDEWLADEKTLPSKEERHQEGQIIINSLCAYIRSSFPLAERHDELTLSYEKYKQKCQDKNQEIHSPLRIPLLKPKNTKATNTKQSHEEFVRDKSLLREEQEVRKTILSEIKKRLNGGKTKNKDGRAEIKPGTWSYFKYDFSNTVFFYDIEFNEVNFSGKKTFFSATKFIRKANFSETTFHEVTDFFGAEFTRSANFFWATFYRDANFSKAKFTRSANFSWATFSQETNFFKAKFTRSANFSEATFYRDANFSKAKFTRGANFSWATFSQETNFFKAKFTRSANFSEAKFAQDLNLKGRIAALLFFYPDKTKRYISTKTNFSRTIFSRDANFFKAKFTRGANFSVATFARGANFSVATFALNADFSEATFSQAKPKFAFIRGDKTYKARFSCKAEHKFDVSLDSYKIDLKEEEYKGAKCIIPKGTEPFDPDDPSESKTSAADMIGIAKGHISHYHINHY